MAIEPYRPEGRYITAVDVAERLMPDLYMSEVLLWSPDLFAYTSYIMTMTSAYQLVVSPPSNRKWPPRKSDLQALFYDGAEENLAKWIDDAKAQWGFSRNFDFEGFFASFRQAIKGLKDKDRISWDDLVKDIGAEWRENLNTLTEEDFNRIDDNLISFEEKRKMSKEESEKQKADRQSELLRIVLTNTPPLLLSCWAFFYKEVTRPDFHDSCTLRISDLLCTQDYIQSEKDYCEKLWKVSQALITMHAIADIASVQFGIKANTGGHPALEFAERLLFGRCKEHPKMYIGGSLSTFNTERCRVLPKRHNPSIGITLRSISSNLAFHQSSVDVVWRKTRNNTLDDRLIRDKDNKAKQISLLLLPFPLTIKTKDFGRDDNAREKIVNMSEKDYGFFTYEPYPEETEGKTAAAREEEIDKAISLIKEANKELPDNLDVDMIVFPEASLSLSQFNYLEERLKDNFHGNNMPSIIIAGVRESRQELAEEMNERRAKQLGRKLKDGEILEKENINFSRNAVYCKYYDYDKEFSNNGAKHSGSFYNMPTVHSEGMPKYKQYKHHRWLLDKSQIKRYGLSGVLDTDLTWWESIKIPKRRVSFLNVGDRMTISHLICEDLARQDPIAELVRHVGPTLVVTILMDGPQLKNRWSARYATVLSDDPGCSVITLTSLGMVKRHSSEFGLMSRVVALWNESGSGHSREIELAQGAEAILLTLRTDETPEKTADGRIETIKTSILRLIDVIQIYPNMER